MGSLCRSAGRSPIQMCIRDRYNVQLLTEKLTRKDNTIGLLFNDPTFYQNLSTTTANAASLLEDLKAHPKRYVHFSLFGKKDK